MQLFRAPREVRHQSRSGRNHTGRITLWGRRATHRWGTPSQGGYPGWGYARVWRTRATRMSGRGVLQGYLVGSAGLAGWGTLSGGTRPGEYVLTTVEPTRVRPGLTTCLRWLPVGVTVGEVSFYARAAGTGMKILRHRNGFTECRLPSRQHKWINSDCFARVGRQGNPEAKFFTLDRAGQSFHRGHRPRTRGVAMNPVDHPHGGGQGKTSGGRPGVTPWGRLTKGYKTVR